MRRINAELAHKGMSYYDVTYTDAFRSADGNGLESPTMGKLWTRRHLRASAEQNAQSAAKCRGHRFSHEHEMRNARLDLAEWRDLGGFLP